MPGLESLKIIKNWTEKTRTREENWDEIANKTTSWASKIVNYLKQIGLDLNGNTYDFNGDGRATQTTSIVSRLTTLEATLNTIGVRNIGLNLAQTDRIATYASDATNLSTANPGVVTFNSTTNPGRVISRNVTANQSLVLTGCHWGFDTDGDLTDVPLWILLLDTGSGTILGVTAQGGRQTIAAADTDTAVGNITSIEKVLVSSAPAATYAATYLGWIKADFDDTGNAGGENFWTLQSAVGDVNIGYVQTLQYGEVLF